MATNDLRESLPPTLWRATTTKTKRSRPYRADFATGNAGLLPATSGVTGQFRGRNVGDWRGVPQFLRVVRSRRRDFAWLSVFLMCYK